MLSRGWREHGELVRFRLGPREFVLFTGPEAHDLYFSAPEDQLNAKAVYQFTVPIFGRGVAYDAAPEIMDEQLGFLFSGSPRSRATPVCPYHVRGDAAVRRHSRRGWGSRSAARDERAHRQYRQSLPHWRGSPGSSGRGFCRGVSRPAKRHQHPGIFFSPDFLSQRIEAVTGPGEEWPNSLAGS